MYTSSYVRNICDICARLSTDDTEATFLGNIRVFRFRNLQKMVAAGLSLPLMSSLKFMRESYFKLQKNLLRYIIFASCGASEGIFEA
jgi:hypothetical protein